MLHKLIGRIANDNPHGDGFGVPSDWQHYTVVVQKGPGKERYENWIRISNDAHEVALGTSEIDSEGIGRGNTIWLFRREVFLRFALWYLWQRIWREWFGLRRKLFYWWLNRDLARWNQRT